MKFTTKLVVYFIKVFSSILFGLIILSFCIARIYSNPQGDEKVFYFTTIGAILGIFVSNSGQVMSKKGGTSTSASVIGGLTTGVTPTSQENTGSHHHPSPVRETQPPELIIHS